MLPQGPVPTTPIHSNVTSDILAKLLRISQAIAVRGTNVAGVIEAISSGVRELLPEAEVAVFLTSETDQDVLEYFPTTSPSAYDRSMKRSIRRKTSLGQALTTGKTIALPAKARLRSRDVYVSLNPATTTAVGFPLVSPRGGMMGAFVVESPNSNAFSPEHLSILEILAGFASTGLSNSQFINELERSWKDLDKASRQMIANASLTVLGEITGNLVHHIGNDIGVAHEEIRDLLDMHREKSPTRSGLIIARRNTRQVLQFIEHLLYRLSATTRLTIEDLDLRDAVSEAIRDYGPLPNNVRLTIKLVPSCRYVRSTRILPFVISELIRNAVKAIGNAPGRIKVHSESHADHTSLFISNSGESIPPDRAPYIFDFLYHRKTRSRQAGMGFGLWWVRSVLRTQGGDISLCDTRGSGTRFEITLRPAKTGTDHE